MSVILDGEQLTLAEVVRVARGDERVEVAPAALDRVRAARAVVERAVAGTDGVYGVTTGVGVRKRVRVESDEMDAYNRRLLRDHRMATGPDAPREVVRAAMVRLANGFAKGTSGVRPELLARVVDALNAGETPRVRMLGSAGQSDLGPLADLAFGICGDMPLAAKEGISLINNNSFGTGLAALALADALRLLDACTVGAALDWEAFAANTSPLHPAVAAARPYPGIVRRSVLMRELLDGSYLWEPGAARNLQDPLTFRNAAGILGAVDDGLGFACRQLAIELNAAHENPLVAVGDDIIISVPNYEALPLAAALDFARIALVPAISSAQERSVEAAAGPAHRPRDGPPGGRGREQRVRAVRARPRPPVAHGRGPLAVAPALHRDGLDAARRGHRGPHHDGAAGRAAAERGGGRRRGAARARARRWRHRPSTCAAAPRSGAARPVHGNRCASATASWLRATRSARTAARSSRSVRSGELGAG